MKNFYYNKMNNEMYNEVVLYHHSYRLIHAHTREDGVTFLCVSVSCPDSDNGYGVIYVSDGDCGVNPDREGYYDIYLGDHDEKRIVNYLKNGKYIRREFTNGQLEDYTRAYYRSHRSPKMPDNTYYPY